MRIFTKCGLREVIGDGVASLWSLCPESGILSKVGSDIDISISPGIRAIDLYSYILKA